MTQPTISKLDITTAIIGGKLKEFRGLVVKNSSALILEELDKVINYVENISKPYKASETNIIEEFLIGAGVLGFIVAPWAFGVYWVIDLLIFYIKHI